MKYAEQTTRELIEAELARAASRNETEHASVWRKVLGLWQIFEYHCRWSATIDSYVYAHDVPNAFDRWLRIVQDEHGEPVSGFGERAYSLMDLFDYDNTESAWYRALCRALMDVENEYNFLLPRDLVLDAMADDLGVLVGALPDGADDDDASAAFRESVARHTRTWTTQPIV